jgi:hypothetical protein
VREPGGEVDRVTGGQALRRAGDDLAGRHADVEMRDAFPELGIQGWASV